MSNFIYCWWYYVFNVRNQLIFKARLQIEANLTFNTSLWYKRLGAWHWDCVFIFRSEVQILEVNQKSIRHMNLYSCKRCRNPLLSKAILKYDIVSFKQILSNKRTCVVMSITMSKTPLSSKGYFFLIWQSLANKS